MSTTLAPSGTTRVLKRRERQRRRMRIGTAGLVAIALLVAVVGAVVLRQATKKDDSDAVDPRTQVTLLLAVRGPDGRAAASALLAHDPADGRASMAFVPPSLRVLAPGVGQVAYDDALRLGGAKAARAAISSLLGVMVDHDWMLTTAGLTALVDRVGQVTLEVDVDVVVGGVLLMNAGSQRVDGARAVAYASYVAPGEEPLAALPRLQRVLEGVLGALPDERQLVTTLESLGRDSAATMDAARLGAFLRSLEAAREAEQVSFATLPVTALDVGGPRTQYTLDEIKALDLVNTTLAASVPEGRRSGDNRVILYNGVGRPGTTTTAQQRLSSQGFQIVKVANANRFDYAKSVVLVRDGTQASQALGAKVAGILRLPVSAVQVYAHENTVSDVIVILGADYRP